MGTMLLSGGVISVYTPTMAAADKSMNNRF